MGHFKNTRETAMNLKGMSLKKARTYLEDVLAHKRCVPFRVHAGGVSRPAQCKEWKWSSGRWPAKSCNFLLDLLQNMEANAEVRGVRRVHRKRSVRSRKCN